MLGLERIHFLAAGELALLDLEAMVAQQLQRAAAIGAFVVGQDHAGDLGSRHLTLS
jgi:hypothetical protein